jgi:hypothetical protein
MQIPNNNEHACVSASAVIDTSIRNSLDAMIGTIPIPIGLMRSSCKYMYAPKHKNIDIVISGQLEGVETLAHFQLKAKVQVTFID